MKVMLRPIAGTTQAGVVFSLFIDDIHSGGHQLGAQLARLHALARELAPLAGHYPAMKVGPAWWFYDSLNGMARYFDQVMETAGLFNTAGFNDDTRAFPSIPARHCCQIPISVSPKSRVRRGTPR